jgi:two-component system, OmpR family, response regulator
MDDHQEQDWSNKRPFTTGEAAELCKVSQQTIIRCFDSGRLSGFRVPGSKFRRIPRDELLRFMRENKIPTGRLEGDTRRVLVVDDDPAVVSLLRDMLARDGRFEIQTAGTGYDAGMLTESFRPHAILLDYMLPDINGNVVCQRIRTSPTLKETKILIISGVVRQDEVRGLLEAGADDFLKKPFSIRQVIERLEALLGLEPRQGPPAGSAVAQEAAHDVS